MSKTRARRNTSSGSLATVIVPLPAPLDQSFTIQAAVTRGHADIEISGNIDLQNVSHVGTMMTALIAELEKRKIHEARVDLRRLYFINSSGLKLFVTWITRVGEMLPVQRYKIVFVANNKLQWQKRSLRALSALDPTLVHLVDEPL
jgi:anti-anti-sigma factor